MSTDQVRNGPAEPTWFKSSHSGTEGGDCVEVAEVPGAVRVRDSKDPSRAGLAIPAGQWAAFVTFATND